MRSTNITLAALAVAILLLFASGCENAGNGSEDAQVVDPGLDAGAGPAATPTPQ